MARRFNAALPAPMPRAARSHAVAQSSGAVSISHPDLVREINSLIASGVRARGVQLVLSPMADAARNIASQEIRPT